MPDARQLFGWARKALSMPPRETVRRGISKLRGASVDRNARRADEKRPTFAIADKAPSLRPVLRRSPIDTADPWPGEARLDGYLRHEFDLLGSGPVEVRHGISCRGLAGHVFPPHDVVQADHSGDWLHGRVNAANVAESRRIWRLVDPDYTPIDWQLDFKSGFRWSELTWYRSIKYGDVVGADVKVPWELARLQHLPQVALAAVETGGNNPTRNRQLVREIQNQLLDFIATNPPRFGVNWAVTMDVAIRAANVILARDILRAGGLDLDSEADEVIRRSVLEHGRHIAGNLEWDPILRGNHYLSDLVGLLFAAAAVERNVETNRWLELARREFLAELPLQFHEDGSNFEGSTPYHRLSTELVIHGVAVLAGSGASLPSDTGARLAAMVDFSRALTGPDGRVTQLGDNDSGRLFKLVPDDPSDSLDQRHLVDALAGLLGDAAGSGIERRVVAAIANGAKLHSRGAPGHSGSVGSAAALATTLERINRLSANARAVYSIPARVGLREGLELRAFPDGGYWLAHSDRLHLVIRCGEIGQRGNGGHDHDDQLAIDLWLDGEHLIEDPGAYVYTPLPEERNRYRAGANHAVPLPAPPYAVGLERPFALGDARPGTCLAFTPDGFAGERTDRLGRVALACIRWFDDRVEIAHGIENGELDPSRRGGDWRVLRPEAPVSLAYGVRLA